MIEIKKLYKSYILRNKKIPILKNINLKIKKGDLVALTGESGSGKSTLLNIIGMLDIYDSGEYYLNDILIKDMNESLLTQYRNKYIGYIFQNFHLIPFKNALENVALPLYYKKIEKEERLNIAMKMLEKMNLKHRAYNKPNELSGGQKQRVAIARALITNPSILLADEPTGALDSETSNQIIDLISDLNKKQGKTVIIVTHEPNIATKCNHQIELKDGKLLI